MQAACQTANDCCELNRHATAHSHSGRRGHPPPGADSGIAFVAFGGTARVAAADAWELGTIWRENLEEIAPAAAPPPAGKQPAKQPAVPQPVASTAGQPPPARQRQPQAAVTAAATLLEAKADVAVPG